MCMHLTCRQVAAAAVTGVYDASTSALAAIQCAKQPAVAAQCGRSTRRRRARARVSHSAPAFGQPSGALSAITPCGLAFVSPSRCDKRSNLVAAWSAGGIFLQHVFRRLLVLHIRQRCASTRFVTIMEVLDALHRLQTAQWKQFVRLVPAIVPRPGWAMSPTASPVLLRAAQTSGHEAKINVRVCGSGPRVSCSAKQQEIATVRARTIRHASFVIDTSQALRVLPCLRGDSVQANTRSLVCTPAWSADGYRCAVGRCAVVEPQQLLTPWAASDDNPSCVLQRELLTHHAFTLVKHLATSGVLGKGVPAGSSEVRHR